MFLKIARFFAFSAFLLALLSTPKTTYACDAASAVSIDPPSACQRACGGTASNWQGDVRFHYADGTTCTEIRYFSDPGCGSPGSNQCPAGCTSSAECGAGSCAGANTSASDYCNNGNLGSTPRYCQGFNCGYECLPPSTCRRHGPGEGNGDFSDQFSCTNFCKTGYSCINNSCQGGIFGATYSNLQDCRDSGCGNVAPPPSGGQRCDTSTWSCVSDPDPSSTCGSCSPPGCTTCGSYVDNWTRPGQCMNCTTRVTQGNSCGSPEWSGACASSCSAPYSCGGPPPVPPSPITPPPPGPCLGNGAGGCDRGGTCCSGLICTGSGVCTNPPIRRFCDPLGPVSGSPANGTRNLPTNVTLSWQTNEDPNRGACSGSGRNFVLTWGHCSTSSYDPATCVQDGTDDGRTNNYTCSSAPSYRENWPGNPYNLTGLSSGWHYWNVVVSCSCHWCETGSPPVQNGNWMFEVNGPPLPPILICQSPAAGNSGDIHDICDRSQGAPLGFGGGKDALGNAMRYNLNARDGGPADARQPFVTHRYFITDRTTGAVLPPFIGPNNGANAPFTLDGRGVPLVNGHRYDWYAISTDNASPPLSNPDSAPSATWNALYDVSNPLVGINGANGCFDTVTPGLILPPNINITTSDPIPGGPPNEASNVRSVIATAYDDSTGATLSTQNIFSSCTWTGGSPGAGNGNCNFNTSWAVPNGHIYRILRFSDAFGIRDGAGRIFNWKDW